MSFAYISETTPEVLFARSAALHHTEKQPHRPSAAHDAILQDKISAATHQVPAVSAIKHVHFSTKPLPLQEIIPLSVS